MPVTASVRRALGVPGSHRRDQTARPDAIAARYGNLMTMYERISGDDPYRTPMRIYPAPITRWEDSGLTTS